MTLWCRVSEWSFDLFSVMCSVISLQCLHLGVSFISLFSVCCVLSYISLLSLSLCLISCLSNTVFASGIEDTFSHGCIFHCFGFATVWLLRKLQIRTRPLSSNVHIWSTVRSVTIYSALLNLLQWYIYFYFLLLVQRERRVKKHAYVLATWL
jgi:hypothetical protein